MRWKGTAFLFIGIILTWTYLDFVEYDAYAWRWWFWATPLCCLGWLTYLLLTEE